MYIHEIGIEVYEGESFDEENASAMWERPKPYPLAQLGKELTLPKNAVEEMFHE